MTLFIGVNFMLGFTIIWMLTKYFPIYLTSLGVITPYVYILTGAIITFISVQLFLLVKLSIYSRRKRSFNKTSLAKLNHEKQKGKPDISVLYFADHYEELVYWLQNDQDLISDVHSIRVFSSFILSVVRAEKSEYETDINLIPQCLISINKTQPLKSNNKNNNFMSVRQNLEDRLIKII